MIKSKKLSEFTLQELQEQLKELKKTKIINAFIIGFTIGIYVYSSLNNGFGIITFFPLIITYLIITNSKKNKELEININNEIN